MVEYLLNKVIGPYPTTLMKENTPIQVPPDEFCEKLNISFL